MEMNPQIHAPFLLPTGEICPYTNCIGTRVDTADGMDKCGMEEKSLASDVN
jgi:hypothetical protein